MMSTAKANQMFNENLCLKYGVEAFEYDYMTTEMRPVDKTALNESYFFMGQPQFKEVEFRCPVVRWQINGLKFSGAVPIHLVANHEANLFGSSKTWHMDDAAMEDELLKMIDKSKSNNG